MDIIDTLKMLIGITFEIEIKWKDDRLLFENLLTEGANLISTETANKLWIPSDSIVYDNTILGDIVIDNRKNVGVRNLEDAIPASITNSIENFKFHGSLYMPSWCVFFFIWLKSSEFSKTFFIVVIRKVTK